MKYSCNKDIRILTIDSPNYPNTLKVINNPPPKLYCIGDIGLLKKKSVAVVGSRKYTLYGKIVAQMIGKELAHAGIPVVSGLAYGIDSYAHEGTVNSSGKAIAVLGTGIDIIYPARNTWLYNKIAQSGLIISEYPPGTPGAKYTFPQRNRIISAISEAVVVVEAGLNSGSLITADFACEQGKSIYAVPGNINSQFSVGTNKLIKDGAIPMISINDVASDIKGFEYIPDDIETSLGHDELEIYMEIQKSTCCTIDSIAHNLNKNAGKVSAILTVLEIKGIITTYGGKVFLAK
nr:DNA-processing protein DprA [uncultured Mogibacterium sp.]